MLTNNSVSPIEPLEKFCGQLTENLTRIGFDIDIRPGVHLVDDAGADLPWDGEALACVAVLPWSGDALAGQSVP